LTGISDQIDRLFEEFTPRSRRPERAYSDLRPASCDIRYAHSLLDDSRLEELSDHEHRIFMRLVRWSAIKRIWTYSPPDESGRDENWKFFPRVLGIEKDSDWPRLKLRFVDLGLIEINDGRLRVHESFAFISSIGVERPAMAPVLRMAILRRDNFTCGYCGSTAGPFDVDHVVPVSRGGSNDEGNLLTACAQCNRSKGAKTIEEWLGGA
jgi:hypothetical protein